MNRKELTIIKLGGSIITDKSKPYSPNLDAIKRLAREIKKANKPVLIVHGQGSFGHTSAKKYGGKKGYNSLLGIAEVFKDAMEINRIVMEELLAEKIPAVSFRPNSLFVASNGKMQTHNLEVIRLALKQGIVPVVYGDVIMDKKWKTTIFSGETTTAFLVSYLKEQNIKIDKVIQVGVTDGVYDKNGNTIPLINSKNYKDIKEGLFIAQNTDVTGGMQHKVENAIQIARMGVSTYIINGIVSNNLKNILLGKVAKHTLIE